MEAAKKPSATIYKFIISNIRGIEVLEYEFKDGKYVLVTYGKNGSGKSSVTDGIYLALGGKKALPGKVDNLVGPFSVGAIKKGSVDLFIRAEPGATELGEDFWVRFGVTEKGTMSLKVTNTESGEVEKTGVGDKVKKLMGMFVDPVKLVRTLEEYNGDKKLAEMICAMVGLDFTPFVTTEDTLFGQFQSENAEKTRQEGVFATLDEPQEDWAKEWTDPAEISTQLQLVESLRNRNEQRARSISEQYKEQDRLCESSFEFWNQVVMVRKEGNILKDAYNSKVKLLDEKKESLGVLQEKNKPEEWKGTQNIEEKIKQLTEELGKLKEHDQEELRKKQEIEAVQKEIDIDSERVSSAAKEVNDKRELLSKSISDKRDLDVAVSDQSKKIEQTHDENVMEKWNGEGDPEKKLFPLQFLNQKMSNVTRMNNEHEGRKAYQQAENGLKTVKLSIQSIEKKRAENRAAKSAAVAAVKDKFPHPGITVDENTVWVDMNDRLGKRTINDLSDGEKLTVCTHILIAGNTGPLKLLIIRDGALLDEDNRQIIYDIAGENGYKVILETIETSEAGALHIVDGRVDSVNQPLIEEPLKSTVADDVEQVIKDNETTDDDFVW